MSHSHSHSEGSEQNTYFLDQICTIAIAGGLAGVAIMMYRTNMLERILVEQFFIPVLLGGCTLLVLVLIRAWSLWGEAGKPGGAVQPSHDHGHAHSHGHEHSHSHGHEHSHAHKEACDHPSHGHEHSHSHGHEHSHSHGHEHSHGEQPCNHPSHGAEHAHAHSHASPAPHHEHGGHAHAEGEDHDHGWSPWKYAILIVPIVLYFLGLPAKGLLNTKQLEADALEKFGGQYDTRVAFAGVAGGVAMEALRPREPLHLKFDELSSMAASPKARSAFTGRLGIVRGQFYKINDQEFTLFFIIRTCCKTDERTLKARIFLNQQSGEIVSGINNQDWVEVRGEIFFYKVQNRNDWIPVLEVNSMTDVRPVKQEGLPE